MLLLDYDNEYDGENDGDDDNSDQNNIIYSLYIIQ
jgi:hypothetical protein